MANISSIKTPLLTKDLSKYGQILTVQLSPYILSQDLILIGCEKAVVLGLLKVDDSIDFNVICEYPEVANSVCLSFSPITSINIIPHSIIFASVATSSPFDIKVVKSNIKGEDNYTLLKGHNDYINDISFDPDNIYFISVSDDSTAIVWSSEDLKLEHLGTLQLKSPGMSVCWHTEDTTKVLIAEKIGIITFFNVETRIPVLSVDYGKPLCSAHWAPSDSQLFTSLQSGELLIWSLNSTCAPISNQLVLSDNGGHVRFSPFNELVAVVNRLDGNVRIFNVKSKQLRMSIPVIVPSNISWHSRSPIICVGDYMKLRFIKIMS